MTTYPTFDDALEIHRLLIERFGGSLGLRDRAGLEAALARPQSGYYVDLIAEASARWESLSQNHPFLDGNKRLSITLTSAFLSVNGVELIFDDLEAYTFVIDLYDSGTFKREMLEKWLRVHKRS